MFVISQTPTILWPVEYVTPRAGGQFDANTFSARLKVLPQERIDAHAERLQSIIEGKEEISISKLDKEWVDEIFDGWGDDLLGANNQPLPENASNRAMVLNLPGMRKAIIAAWKKTLNGEAELKNSKTPRITG